MMGSAISSSCCCSIQIGISSTVVHVDARTVLIIAPGNIVVDKFKEVAVTLVDPLEQDTGTPTKVLIGRGAYYSFISISIIIM